jgi:hypothetical protein
VYRGGISGDYGSHIPILASVVAASGSRQVANDIHPLPVLELGAGDSSTPLLHYLCRSLGKDLLTADTDGTWLERFAEYRSVTHSLIHVSSWDVFPRTTDDWGVVFVDCAPGEERHKIIERLAKSGRVRYVVAHDSERDHGAGGNYEYEKIMPLFRWRVEFRRFRPYTLILSNVCEFSVEECDLTWEPPS